MRVPCDLDPSRSEGPARVAGRQERTVDEASAGRGDARMTGGSCRSGSVHGAGEAIHDSVEPGAGRGARAGSRSGEAASRRAGNHDGPPWTGGPPEAVVRRPQPWRALNLRWVLLIT